MSAQAIERGASEVEHLRHLAFIRDHATSSQVDPPPIQSKEKKSGATLPCGCYQ